jgi:hypothetical protein
MSEIKYEYLYNQFNELIHNTNAIRGADYRMYKDFPLDYTFKQGDQREFFTLKNGSETGGESPEHYNAKMKIVKEKKYFDTIFKQWIEFDNVIEEIYQIGNKKPDLSCYDDKGELVMCIEIFFTHRKSDEDIEQLKKIQVPIVEINIKNENKCNHIILPALLESKREQYNRLRKEINRIQRAKQFNNDTNRGYRNEIEKYQEKIQFCIRSTQQNIKYLAEYSNRRQAFNSKSMLRISIKSIRAGIKQIQGDISWQNNRSRQADTIIKRGF